MGYFALLVATLAVVAASPSQIDLPGTGVRNSALEQIVIDVLESFRDLMLNGSEDIPVLDPFQLDHLHLDLGDLLNLDNSHVTVQNLEARQLSTYVIDEVSLTMTSLFQQRFALVVEGHIPLLEADADHYDLDVNALGFHLFGAGKAKFLIKEPRIIANLDVSINILAGMSITLNDAKVSFSLGAVEPQLTGMFHNTLSDEFVNLFLKHLIEDIVVTYEEEISEFISELFLEIGGQLLDNRMAALQRKATAEIH